MSQRIVMDPVTRIEGHLRVEAQVEGGQVTDAWSSGTMWRGIENVIIGRDPREAWLFAQRICGVCTTVHAQASVRAVEDALDITPPLAASLIRDLIALRARVPGAAAPPVPRLRPGTDSSRPARRDHQR